MLNTVYKFEFYCRQQIIQSTLNILISFNFFFFSGILPVHRNPNPVDPVLTIGTHFNKSCPQNLLVIRFNVNVLFNGNAAELESKFISRICPMEVFNAFY